MAPRWITVIATVALAAVTGLLGAPTAGADRSIPVTPGTYCPSALMFYNPGFCDPRLPDPAHGHCDGGRVGSLMTDGYCDGAPYEDGSYWRVTQGGVATVENPKGWMAMSRQCLIRIGEDVQPAPPGGCNGSA